MLVCDDDVNLLSKNMNIITRNTEVLSAANREVHLEVIAVKTSFVLCCGNGVGRNHNVGNANRTFKNVAKFGCLGIMLMNENCM
jgi:hypothetical protein